MPNHNLQEPLQTLPTVFNYIVIEAVREDFARKWRDRDAGRLTLQDVAERLEIGVPTPHRGRLELERRNIGTHDNLVGRVSASAASAVGYWVANLHRRRYQMSDHVGEITELMLTSISRKFSGGP
jgi:hypothetical protein